MPIKANLGAKITASHRTLTETAEEVAACAVKLECIHKISLGTIKHVPGGRRDLKFLPMNAGIKAVIRGNGAVQDLYIYTKKPDEVKRALEQDFEK